MFLSILADFLTVPSFGWPARPRLFSWAVWHSCRMGARNQEQTRGRIGPQLRLGNLRVGELHFCPLCTALDQASSLSRKLAYVPGPTFGFVKLLASSGSHCTKWADEQHRQAGFESRLVPDLPLPFIPTLIGLRAFDLVSSRVWWEAATNIWPQLFLWSPVHPISFQGSLRLLHHRHHHVTIFLILFCYPSLSSIVPADLQGYIPYRHRAVRSSWSPCLCSVTWRGPLKYIPYELVPTSPFVSCMSGSSNFDSFHDVWLVAVQMLLCGVLPPGLVKYCSQHSCVVAVKLFSIRLVSVNVVHPYRSIDTTATWKKLRFSWVCTNGPGDRGSIPGRVIRKIQKWYLMPLCLTLNIIRYGSRVMEVRPYR